MNLLDLVARIILNTDDFDNGLDRARGAAKKFGSALKSGLTTAAKVSTVALGAATTAVGALTKASLDSYAEYEQLVGGVETLFKDSADTVQEYAANAYKTAGISANDYMEQATAFSASLIQSLGGDTQAAAEYANQAIMDMSDNANKMGTDIGSIQQTYQSLMRGNYAMLDNLKLGYGGTKKELERLVADAEQLTGQALDPTKFSDVITAIHAVQTEMGITGTTAKEASSTIEGSIASMKAAWSNLVTGIGNENANLDKLIENFVDSAATAAENLVPRIEQILVGIGSVIEKLAPIIAERLPALVTSVLPSLMSAGGQLVGGFFNGIMAALPTLAKTLLPMVTTLVEGFASALPQIADFAVEIITTLAEGILDNLPELTNAALEVILMLADAFLNALPEIVKAGVQVISTLALGIAEALPTLIPTIVDVMIEIIEILTEPDTLSMLIDAALQIIIALAFGLIQALPKLIEAIPEIIKNLVEAIVQNAPAIAVAALELMMMLGEGIIASIPKLLAYVVEIPAAIIGGIKEGIAGIVDIGPQIIEGLVDGIKRMGAWLEDQISGFFSGIVDGVKDLLGIHSPSRVFAGIGENMALGLGAGWDSEFSYIKDKIKNGMEFGTATVDFESSGLAASSRSMASNLLSGMQESGSVANIEINITSELDGEILARKLLRYNRAEDSINGHSLVEGVSM